MKKSKINLNKLVRLVLGNDSVSVYDFASHEVDDQILTGAVKNKKGNLVQYAIQIRMNDENVDGLFVYEIPVKDMVIHQDAFRCINNNYKTLGVKNVDAVRKQLVHMGYMIRENVRI